MKNHPWPPFLLDHGELHYLQINLTVHEGEGTRDVHEGESTRDVHEGEGTRDIHEVEG